MYDKTCKYVIIFILIVLLRQVNVNGTMFL